MNPLAEKVLSRCVWRGDCLEWTGGTRSGYSCLYAKIDDKWKNLYGHRVVWEAEHGPIPPGLLIRHLCHNPKCVNIDHLAVGTHQDNMRDKRESGPKPTRGTISSKRNRY